MNDLAFIHLPKADVFTVVDADVFQELNRHNWWLSHDGYVIRRQTTRATNGPREKFSMHRVVNATPAHLETDHINGNTLDNRRCNLRGVIKRHNMANSKKRVAYRGTPTSSQFKGVGRIGGGKWAAHIRVNHRLIHLGCFPQELEAARAYNAAALQHDGPFARLNTLP